MTSRQIFSDSEKICLQELIVKYNLHKSSTLTGNQSAKKILWLRLTEEYNTIESNSKRSEAQLKKCWDNLKTRQKGILSQEKRQRMRTGGGTFQDPNEPQPSSSNEILIAEALADQTDVELSGVIDSDTNYTSDITEITIETPSTSQAQRVDETSITVGDMSIGERENIVETPPRRRRLSGSRLTDYSAAPSQGPRNVRTRVIQDEYNMRQEGYFKAQRREDELHSLRKREKELMILAAEETLLKAKVEREAAEQLLHCYRAKRELAEYELNIKITES